MKTFSFQPLMTADLTDDEIASICRPLRQPAAQARYLRDVLRVHSARRPDGSLLVSRQHYEFVRNKCSVVS